MKTTATVAVPGIHEELTQAKALLDERDRTIAQFKREYGRGEQRNRLSVEDAYGPAGFGHGVHAAGEGAGCGLAAASEMYG